MRPNISTNQDGYIALISAIVISILLLAITFTLSFTAFYSRFNVLDSEYKKASSALAAACVNTAMLKIANDATYIPVSGGDEIIIDTTTNKKCKILTVTGTGTARTIQTQAVYQKAYTNLEVDVVLAPPNITVATWEELANF